MNESAPYPQRLRPAASRPRRALRCSSTSHDTGGGTSTGGAVSTAGGAVPSAAPSAAASAADTAAAAGYVRRGLSVPRQTAWTHVHRGTFVDDGLDELDGLVHLPLLTLDGHRGAVLIDLNLSTRALAQIADGLPTFADDFSLAPAGGHGVFNEIILGAAAAAAAAGGRGRVNDVEDELLGALGLLRITLGAGTVTRPFSVHRFISLVDRKAGGVASTLQHKNTEVW